MRPEEGLPVSSERILCFVSCGSPRWFSSTGTPFSLFYSSTSTCCEPVRATMKSSSPTVRATPGGRGTSSPPSASRTLSCTPAPKRASWRCGLGAGWRGAGRCGAQPDLFARFGGQAATHACPSSLPPPLSFRPSPAPAAMRTSLICHPLPGLTPAPASQTHLLVLGCSEPGNSVRVGRDAAVGHRRRRDGLLFRIRARREEASMGQDLHAVCEWCTGSSRRGSRWGLGFPRS